MDLAKLKRDKRVLSQSDFQTMKLQNSGLQKSHLNYAGMLAS